MYFNQTIFKLFSDSLHVPALTILIKHEAGLSGRAMSRLLGVSPFKSLQVLEGLFAQGVLRKSVVGRSHLYQINSAHLLIKEVIQPLVVFQEKLFGRLGQTVLRGLKPKPLTVILYGSLARGDERPDSDIDLFLVFKDGTDVSLHSEKNLLFYQIALEYGNQLSLHGGCLKDVLERYKKKDEYISNIFKRGRVIAGLSFVELTEYGLKANQHTTC